MCTKLTFAWFVLHIDVHSLRKGGHPLQRLRTCLLLGIHRVGPLLTWYRIPKV